MLAGDCLIIAVPAGTFLEVKELHLSLEEGLPEKRSSIIEYKK
jgi:hypothetical protein